MLTIAPEVANLRVSPPRHDCVSRQWIITNSFCRLLDSSQEIGVRWKLRRYGGPKKLLSDQGREFVNRLNTDLAKKFDIDHM
ncbi:hypothetical protein LSAT2_019103 [Lamellibrachia satsuma]|nr:hypothetical protein LSAT2_019103 [Lamellibrachia satsuma]